jgi:hypothetical protein
LRSGPATLTMSRPTLSVMATVASTSFLCFT